MKKFYLLLLALVVSVGAVSAKTVYFENTANWPTVKVHHWTDGGAGSSWPGDNPDGTIQADNGKTYYFKDTDRAKIIFNNNNGGQQTKDLPADDGAVYSYAQNNNGSSGNIYPIGTITKRDDGTYHFLAAGEVELTPGHLYFPVENFNVTTAKLYTWEPQITEGWPGSTLTKVTLGDNKQYWQFTISDVNELEGKTVTGWQINNGSSSNQKEYKPAGGLTIHDGDIIDIPGMTGIVGNHNAGKYPGAVEEKTDYSSWWIALGGAFNGYDYFEGGKTETQPTVEGIATFRNIAIGGSNFEIKVWDNSADTYYNYSEAPIKVGEPTKVSHSDGGTKLVIDGYKKGAEYTIEFNCATQEVTLTLTKEGEGEVEEPVVDYTKWYIALGGAFNNYDYFEGGKTETQPTAEGVATFSNIAIGGSNFEIKVWDNSNDTYYNYSEAPVKVGEPTKVSHSDDGTKLVIDGYKNGAEYTIEFNCATQEVTLTLTKEGEEVEPEPEKWYIIGTLEVSDGAFNPSKGVELADEGDGQFVAYDVTILPENAGNKYGRFFFSTTIAENADDWGALNGSLWSCKWRRSCRIG